MNKTEYQDRLVDFPFEEHNAEVRAMWDAYREGKPTRTPIILGLNTRFFMMKPACNPNGPDFRWYMECADEMFDQQLRAQRWARFNMLQDAELGIPEKWVIGPDFQNTYEASWFGCPVDFPEGQVPSTHPAFGDCPERIMERGLPDPFGGSMARALEFQYRYLDRASREMYLDRPIEVGMPGWGTGSDGPFTVACNCFGPDWVCMALAAEPERLHVLLDFITTAIIRRITSWREKFGLEMVRDDCWLADDCIALISTPMYREHILPYHWRYYDAFATPVRRSMHLCGNSTRHMKTIHEELNVTSFDTGFPVDFAWLRGQLGLDVTIQGGPHVDIVRSESPHTVYNEARRILGTGVLEGGMFVLREGNNLAPGTPIANCEAMYRAGREHGYACGTDDPAGVLDWLDSHPILEREAA